MDVQSNFNNSLTHNCESISLHRNSNSVAFYSSGKPQAPLHGNIGCSCINSLEMKKKKKNLMSWVAQWQCLFPHYRSMYAIHQLDVVEGCSWSCASYSSFCNLSTLDFLRIPIFVTHWYNAQRCVKISKCGRKYLIDVVLKCLTFMLICCL